MKKVYILGFLMLISASVALAHGKAVTFMKPADLLKFYPQSAELKSMSTPDNKNNPYSSDAGKTKWMKVVTVSGQTIGIIGMEKVETPHGHLINAVCFDEKGENIIKIALIKSSREEAKELIKLTANNKWWEKYAAPEKALNAGGILLRSVARTKAALKKE